MKNIPTIYMESLLCFVGVFIEKIFKNLKTALNIYGKFYSFCTGVLEKFIKIFFLSQSLLKENKNTPYTIYGKLGVKSFTFLCDLSNESQNITKKDMPLSMTYLSFIYYLIVVSCLNIKAG